jgi:serine protease AprX
LERRNRQQIQVAGDDLPITPQYVQSVKATGAVVYNASKWLNAITVRVSDSAMLANVASLPFVQRVDVVARYVTEPSAGNGVIKRPFQMSVSSEPPYSDEAYGIAHKQIDILNGVGLHRKGLTGNGVLVAIFDAGFSNADQHPGLRHIFTDNRLVATRDFVTPGASVFNSSNHGTQCFSIIGNYAPGAMIGTAPGASFVLCHTEQGGSEMPIEEFNWAAAAEYADSIGADIISSSLGYTTFDDSTLNHTYEDMDGNTTIAAKAADKAASKGIVVVNSAGNNGQQPWFYISTPADGDSVLTVGAVTALEELAAFSSRGYSADGQVKPDVMGMGHRNVVANPNNMDYLIGSGTSYACPTISGMAACLVQAHPNRTAMDIMNAIRMSADRFQNPNPDYGYGIPDFQLADLLLSNVQLQDFANDPSPMVFPNPFGQNITVVHYSDVRETGRVEIVDMMGRMQRTSDFVIQPGYNQLVTEFANRPAGLYVIRLTTESRRFELKALHQ